MSCSEASNSSSSSSSSGSRILLVLNAACTLPSVPPMVSDAKTSITRHQHGRRSFVEPLDWTCLVCR